MDDPYKTPNNCPFAHEFSSPANDRMILILGRIPPKRKSHLSPKVPPHINVEVQLPNGLALCPFRVRLGRKRLGNGKLPKLRDNSKKRTESQPSGARFVRWLFPVLFDNGGKPRHCQSGVPPKARAPIERCQAGMVCHLPL